MSKLAERPTTSPRVKVNRSRIMSERGNSTVSRTAPNGKRAVVSDGAVDSISRNMEKRTKKAIRKIGRSIGF